MKLFKNKKGSVLVERILMVAFAVAAGGGVIVYGSQVITDAKNTQITGILGNNGQTDAMTQEQILSHFDDTSKNISITLEELNTKSFSNTGDYVRSLHTSGGADGSTVTANGYTFSFDEAAGGEYLRWYHSSGFNFSIGDGAPGKNISIVRWSDSLNGYESLDFATGFTLHSNSETFYNNLKQALIADLG